MMYIGKTKFVVALVIAAFLNTSVAQEVPHPQAINHLNQLDCVTDEVAQFNGAEWTCAAVTDGGTTISQSRALAGGVTPGDAPGFPVTINDSGSYRLTGNLTVPDAATTAIEVNSDDVTIDLNGYAIVGPVVCTGFVVTCSPSGNGRGINATSFAGRNVSVFNGTVKGMGSFGVFLREDCRIEDVTATSNGGSGIAVSTNSIVKGSTASNNGGNGISVGGNGIALQNTAERNRLNGIDTSGATTVRGNTATNNNAIGIDAAGGGNTVTGNTAAGNQSHGINVWGGSTVSGNTAVNNGGDGISDGAGSLVKGGSTMIGNTLRSNSGFGLNLGTDTAYANNVITFNNGDNANPQTSGGIEFGTNVCGTNTTCP